MDDGLVVAELAMSLGGCLGEGQNIDSWGDVRFVEVVKLELWVDMVLIDSTSDRVFR